MYFTYAEQNRTLQALGMVTETANVTGLTQPEQVRVANVSDGVLQALAVQPVLGRCFRGQTRCQRSTNRDAELRLLAAAFGGDHPVSGRKLIGMDSRARSLA